MNNTDRTDRIIEISVGDDLVLAQAVAASLDEERIEAELVLSSDPYVGLAHTSPHRLMIRESDVDAARPIIESHRHDSFTDEPVSARTHGARRPAAFVLLVVFAGGPLLGIVMILRELLG